MVHAGGRATADNAHASLDAVKALMDAMIQMARDASDQVARGHSPARKADAGTVTRAARPRAGSGRPQTSDHSVRTKRSSCGSFTGHP